MLDDEEDICPDQWWPDDSPQYLSKEWMDEQHEWLEEHYGGGSTCGGLSGPEPCGGCIDCMHAQMSYYNMKERERVNVLQAAGFEVLDSSVVTLSWERGMSAGHDAYNCKMANERDEFFFPWEKREKVA